MPTRKKEKVPVNEPTTEEEIAAKAHDTELMMLTYDQWDEELRGLLGVYMIDGCKFIARLFNQINFRQVTMKEAGEILVQNANFLLKNRYFKVHSDDVYDRINDIVKRYEKDPTSYIRNYFYMSKSYSDTDKLKDIPPSCIAFRNGVYDFAKDDWLFKYTKVKIESLNQEIVNYDPTYVIFWYYNVDFEPMSDYSVSEMNLEDFVEGVRVLTCPQGESHNNFCFELVWNMAHDEDGNFSMKKFTHLCMIMGYMLYQPFCDNFVILIGNGQNGKNTLFDSCVKSAIEPTPTGVSMDDIENDQFVTESFINRYQNIFLESEAKPYEQSMRLKNLTGSMFQTVNQKGVQKYQAIINCKNLFSANDRDKIKFSDSTHGFTRRINLCELYYQWDSKGRYMERGDKDWYDTKCSEDLHEITSDDSNVIMFTYLAMFGIKIATKNFTESFKFGEYNEWNAKQYFNYNTGLLNKINNSLTYENLVNFYKENERNPKKYSEIENSILDGKESLFKKAGFETSKYKYQHMYSNFFMDLGYTVTTDVDEETGDPIGDYISTDLYDCIKDTTLLLSVDVLKTLTGSVIKSSDFISELRKMYPLAELIKPKGTSTYYIPVRFNPDRLTITIVSTTK